MVEQAMTRAKGRRVMSENENSDLQDTGFFNPHDGLKGRDGGPYLDHVNRQIAEVNRAQQEKREPADLNGPLPADAGTPLVIAALVQDNSAYSNPSMASRTGFEAILTDDVLTSAEQSDDRNDVSFADPISVLPVDYSDTPDDSNTVDPTVDGNPSFAGANAAAQDGDDVITDAVPNGNNDNEDDE